MVDWVMKKRVQELLDGQLKGKEFSTADVLALLPKDRHTPTMTELGNWLRCVAKRVSPYESRTGKLAVWCSE